MSSSAASASSSNSTSPFFRHTPRLLDRLWDADWVIRLASKRADQGRPEEPGRADGVDAARRGRFQRKEIDKLLDWLARRSRRFDVVNLPYTLLIGLAAPIARARRADLLHAAGRGSVPGRPWRAVSRQQALDLIRAASAHVDRVPAGQPTTTTTTCPAISASRARRCASVPLGINVDGYTPRPRPRAPATSSRSASSRGSRRRKACTCSPTLIAGCGSGPASALPAGGGRVPGARAPAVSRERQSRMADWKLARRLRVSRRARSRRQDRVPSEPRRHVGAGHLRRAERHLPARGDGATASPSCSRAAARSRRFSRRPAAA